MPWEDSISINRTVMEIRITVKYLFAGRIYTPPLPPGSVNVLPQRNEVALIRAAFDEGGEVLAVVELRRLLPGVTENVDARLCARRVAGWCRASIRTMCQRQSALQLMVALRWVGTAAVKPLAAAGGGLKGQALRASAQPRHWETDAT
jgi:hypothetical protein